MFLSLSSFCFLFVLLLLFNILRTNCGTLNLILSFIREPLDYNLSGLVRVFKKVLLLYLLAMQ